jgi:hypothetical protein
LKDTKANTFEIFIPDLTNSYFNRILINGEYIKVNQDKDMLFWHNERYITHALHAEPLAKP